MIAVIIMAGGSGERFWPLSTPENPKQLLKIFSDKSMIRETVDRILPLVSKENIFIGTNLLQAKLIEKELFDIPKENILVEPLFKDTAAAIGYASLMIKNKLQKKIKNKEKINVIVLAADHLIKNDVEFRNILQLALKEVDKNNGIVTLGIKPYRAETGYGYIEVDNDQYILNNIYSVKKFREKPNLETAEEYLESKRYLWNSGMFIFSLDDIMKNFELLMPDHWKILCDIEKKIVKNYLNKELLVDLIKEDFKKFDKISIDYGILEKTNNIKVIPVDIGWNDVGSFSVFDELFDKDLNGNIIKNCNVSLKNSYNNIIYSEGEEIVLTLLGLDDIVFIRKDNRILLAKKSQLQEIKNVLKENKLC